MNKFFKLEENGTTVGREIMAGLTTFFAMSYILFVNPQVLSTTGMPVQAVFLATILASIVGTLAIALIANVPYALAPGMGLNAFFAYTVVLSLGYTWQEALAMVFICGIINIIITFTSIRKAIILGIPESLQHAIGGGIGIFIAYIGIKNAGILRFIAERLEESKKDQFAKAAVAKAQDAQWEKRESARDELGNWQEWRDIAESIRQHTLKYLPHYLTEFSDNVAARGGHVFFAADAKEANDYVKRIVLEKNAKKIVKSKSMVTTEVDIDPMLVSLSDDMDILETDLAEFILQVADWDEPSHIVFPALHKNRDQIREIFAKKLGYEGDNDPVNLARCARDTMRKLFLKSEVGITGCNFAIANTGDINLSTNEGNADLTISIPKTQIVLMGMERIVPSIKEAEILDNMLARSAVGQKLTTYVTFAGQQADDESDGPEDFHVVIVDNGRSNAIGTAFEAVLQCIRCGA